MLPDVNVLVYAHRRDSVNHSVHRQWLDSLINSDEAYGISSLVLSGFVRVVTHPKVFDPPTRLADALVFVNQLRDQPNCVIVDAGPRHWEIFQRLCVQSEAKGNLIPDAYLAALAIESGCEWVTTDRDFSRFDGLRWHHP